MLCNQGLRSHKGINCSMSGSTGIVAFLQVRTCCAYPL